MDDLKKKQIDVSDLIKIDFSNLINDGSQGSSDQSLQVDDNALDYGSVNFDTIIRSYDAIQLDPKESHLDILEEINNSAFMSWKFNVDYESMKILLKQAKDNNVDFYNSYEDRASFILCNPNEELKERVLRDEGYTEAKITSRIIDPHLYHTIYNVLCLNNDMLEVNDRRKMVIDMFMNNAEMWNDPKSIAHFMKNIYYYFNIDFDEIPLSEGIRKFALDLLSDYLFEDYYHNIWSDLNQIIKYVNLLKKETTGIPEKIKESIPSERIEFYKLFVELQDASVDNIIDFFNQHKDKHIIEQFYDDIRILKNNSYESLVNRCTTLTNDSPLYNKGLSDEYGCDIYYLDGDDFYAFARTKSNVKKQIFKPYLDGGSFVPSDQPSEEVVNEIGYSFTYLNKYDVQTYKDPKECMTLLYSGINPKYIGHVYKNDSETDPEYYYYSDKINELHTPDSITQESMNYPEIFVTNQDGIKPIALLCIDSVSKWDIEFSKKNGLPIVIVNSSKYERKRGYENILDNNYVR